MIESTLHRIWRGPLTVFSPDDTLQVMWEIFPRFSGFRQQVRVLLRVFVVFLVWSSMAVIIVCVLCPLWGCVLDHRLVWASM